MKLTHYRIFTAEHAENAEKNKSKKNFAVFAFSAVRRPLWEAVKLRPVLRQNREIGEVDNAVGNHIGP